MKKNKEKLINELKEQIEKLKKFQVDFKKNLSDENNMKSTDLGYMNGQVESMRLDNEILIGKYFKYKENQEETL
nr:hypothetical protein [uncultured Mediterranean phage uvMED]